MNIGILLPVKKKWWKPVTLKTYPIEIAKDLSLVVCLLPYIDSDAMCLPSFRKRFKARLDRIFEEQNAWPILEHPDIRGLYEVDTSLFAEVIKTLALQQFSDILSSIQGVGALINKEILVTGSSEYLEHAIEILITKVKTINILIPRGVSEPIEAEKAFLETGIPVHITTDHDVLNRTGIWIRFPDDNENFDELPRMFKGLIVDFGAMKIIDTKLQKIFGINIEFSDRIKRKLGQQLLNSWGKGVLEGFIILVCANEWDINESEVFKRLEMRFSFLS